MGEGVEAAVVQLPHLYYPLKMEKLSQEGLRRFRASHRPVAEAAGKQAGKGDWSPAPRVWYILRV